MVPPDPLNKGCQHPFHFNHSIRQLLVCCFFQEAQVFGKQQVIFQFACRSHGYLEETTELRIATTSTAFSDIGRN